MRGVLLALVVVLGLVQVGSALGDHLDPQKRITPADQARARSMVLKRSDLPPGFVVEPTGAGEPHIDCAPSVGESDLTLTGDVEGSQFRLGPVAVNSAAQIYESAADASASWRRSTSAVGTRCVTDLLRREFAKQGIRLTSFRKLAFPRVAERTVAYRVTLSLDTPQGAVPLYADVVALKRSRAHAEVFVASALVRPDRAAEIRLARLVAGRMARAMRGS